MKYHSPLVESRELAMLTSFPLCFPTSFYFKSLLLILSAVSLAAEALEGVIQ